MIALLSSEIHLWHIDQASFDDTDLEKNCLPWLSQEETQRYQRFHLSRHRKQYLLGRALIRTGLSQYCSINAGQWEFSENGYGKPAIANDQNADNLFFNLSHSANRLVLAIARIEMLGVDIERSDRSRRIKQIADRYFSQNEVSELLALPIDTQLDRFYDLWTLKEAYIKACGLGLAIPLQHFTYQFLNDFDIGISFSPEREDSADQWQFWQLNAGKDFKLALAVKDQEANVSNIFSRRFLTLNDFEELETDIIRSNA